jgi:hypothetical protein
MKLECVRPLAPSPALKKKTKIKEWIKFGKEYNPTFSLSQSEL